jgi:hypothetical protein
MHYLVRFSPSLVLFVWVLAAWVDGAAARDVAFGILVAVALVGSEYERVSWKRRRRT